MSLITPLIPSTRRALLLFSFVNARNDSPSSASPPVGKRFVRRAKRWADMQQKRISRQSGGSGSLVESVTGVPIFAPAAYRRSSPQSHSHHSHARRRNNNRTASDCCVSDADLASMGVGLIAVNDEASSSSSSPSSSATDDSELAVSPPTAGGRRRSRKTRSRNAFSASSVAQDNNDAKRSGELAKLGAPLHMHPSLCYVAFPTDPRRVYQQQWSDSYNAEQLLAGSVGGLAAFHHQQQQQHRRHVRAFERPPSRHLQPLPPAKAMPSKEDSRSSSSLGSDELVALMAELSTDCSPPSSSDSASPSGSLYGETDVWPSRPYPAGEVPSDGGQSLRESFSSSPSLSPPCLLYRRPPFPSSCRSK
uniref:Uncharacterized protein n=1 Tax=Plectus sambesii TaxID=2011161 RepID=A0A914XPD6_9BILA